MKVTFEYDVDFMRLPLDPLTIGNCRKCAFFGEWGKQDRCVRTDHRICNTGRAGYFSENYMGEVSDFIVKTRFEGKTG
jgi:hypothetical protein